MWDRHQWATESDNAPFASTPALASPENAGHLSYWLDRLRDSADAVLELPLDRPRPTIRTYAGDQVSFVIPEAVAHAVLQFKQNVHLSSFALMLGTFALFLHKLTLQDDIMVGSVFANRARFEFHPLIGFFVNTLALKTTVCVPYLLPCVLCFELVAC